MRRRAIGARGHRRARLARHDASFPELFLRDSSLGCLAALDSRTLCISAVGPALQSEALTMDVTSSNAAGSRVNQSPLAFLRFAKISVEPRHADHAEHGQTRALRELTRAAEHRLQLVAGDTLARRRNRSPRRSPGPACFGRFGDVGTKAADGGSITSRNARRRSLPRSSAMRVRSRRSTRPWYWARVTS